MQSLFFLFFSWEVVVETQFIAYNCTDRILNLLKEDSKMAYVINENCISCGACEPECPVNAITAGDSIYVIDEAACIDCGACANVCPVDAPQPK